MEDPEFTDWVAREFPAVPKPSRDALERAWLAGRTSGINAAIANLNRWRLADAGDV